MNFVVEVTSACHKALSAIIKMIVAMPVMKNFVSSKLNVF